MILATLRGGTFSGQFQRSEDRLYYRRIQFRPRTGRHQAIVENLPEKRAVFEDTPGHGYPDGRVVAKESLDHNHPNGSELFSRQIQNLLRRLVATI